MRKMQMRQPVLPVVGQRIWRRSLTPLDQAMASVAARLPQGGPTRPVLRFGDAAKIDWKSRVVSQVQELMSCATLPGCVDGPRMAMWWATSWASPFSLVKPIARIFLSTPAGNGFLER